MTVYEGSILLIELMMIALCFHVIRYRDSSRHETKWIIATFVSIMTCACAEYLALHYNGRGPENIWWLTIVTVIQFSLAPMLPVFFAGALGMHEVAKPSAALFFVNVVTEIVAAPFGYIFYFDETGTYYHGNYYYIYITFYFAGLTHLIICLFLVSKKFKYRDYGTIIMVLIIMLAALYPLLKYKIHTDFIGIAIAAAISYIYFSDLVQQDVMEELDSARKHEKEVSAHIIIGLANIIESRDLETGEHVARTRAYVKMLAEKAREDGVYANTITDDYIDILYDMAPLHDLGKISVSDVVLKKRGKLTPEEYEEIKIHAPEGGRIVREVLEGVVDAKNIKIASDIAEYHHERWDGKGYPKGLAGNNIPLPARIMAIADVYDALTAERCYKKPIPADKAFKIIEEGSGTQFDPRLAKVFLKHKEDITNMQI